MKRVPLGLGLIAAFFMTAAGLQVHADAPPGHFTDLGDGTIRDNLTTLTWQKDQSPSTQSQAASVTYCARLTLAGPGWRLPTVYELRSIVDESRERPSLDPLFLWRSDAFFWSSSPVAGNPGYAWYVYFGYGFVNNNIVSNAYRARCVR